MARNLRDSKLSSRQAHEVRQALAEDIAAGIWRVRSVPSPAWETAVQLALELGTRLPMRSLDTLHVACALALSAGEFWTLDREQSRVAAGAGLRVRP